MGNTVTTPQYVWLNGNKFKINGRVRRIAINQWPEKRVEGDYQFSDQKFLSESIFNDQTGGIGKENSNGVTNLNRCWWSTLNLDWENHLLPQPLATALTVATLPTMTDGAMEVWADANTLTNWTWTGGAGDLDREATVKHGGTYSAKLSAAGTLYQDLAGFSNDFRGKLITVRGYLRTGGGVVSLGINDGIGSTTVNVATDNEFHEVVVSRTLNAAATKIRITVISDGTSPNTYADDLSISAIGTYGKPCNHGTDTYYPAGSVLLKVNSTTGNLVLEGIFPATITGLVSFAGNLAVLQGDSVEFWYITSAGVFTETGETGAYYGIDWEDHFLVINTSGQMKYTDTLSATPEFTNKGLISDGSTINSLEIYHDTALDDQVYCGTNKNLWVHDFTNGKFLPTNIKFASHPNACKGLMNWNVGLYISMGLHVKQYVVDSGTASVTPMGLDRDDGVPNEYAGEIVAFIEDNDCFYAIVDSTQHGTTGYSWIAKYNGKGWQCLWAAGTANHAMHNGIVTDVYTRGLLFDSNGTVYRIPLQRTPVMPKKVSTYTYAAAGIHITPWLNGGSEVHSKLARALKRYCSGLSTTETITIKYRTDKAYTDIASGWTTLVTLDTTGENGKSETNFQTAVGGTNKDVGLVNKYIQFRFDLARGDTTTNAPDLNAFSLTYRKILPAKYGWELKISGKDNLMSPAAVLAALKAAYESETLIIFMTRSTEYYAQVYDYEQLATTGADFEGDFLVKIIEL